MASKSQRAARRRQKAERAAALAQQRGPSDASEAYKPKPGPGQVFAKIGDDQGNAGKRLRNMGASPLLLALHRGQLTCEREAKWQLAPMHNPPPAIMARDRFDCGEIFEKRWSLTFASRTRDSLDHGIGGGAGGFTEAQQDAGRAVQRLKSRMALANYRIVQAFCGEGYSMPDSLRQAGVEAHPVGTAYRIREALDDLVHALTGMREDAAVDKRVAKVDAIR